MDYFVNKPRSFVTRNRRKRSSCADVELGWRPDSNLQISITLSFCQRSVAVTAKLGDQRFFFLIYLFLAPQSAGFYRGLQTGPFSQILKRVLCGWTVVLFASAKTEEGQFFCGNDRINFAATGSTFFFSDRINFSATGSTLQRPIQLRTDKFKFAATKSTLHRQNQLCSDRINNNYNSDKRADFKI